MNSPATSVADPHNPPRQMLGYELLERIGSGGYGEVWRVRAPGGLRKALKLIYGRLDDDRARREQRALNRMTEVRHPFVLSIERVEIVDGTLVIVTELADGSIKQRFDECRAAGLRGIPREELLGYMRDIADALDFICQQHTLQHLDVKPENLLLVAGRVKVADFGLVRSIGDAAVSAFNALTPLYAPPEAFDGRPDSNSDQYSLAIVYQEMLTGVLPFSGRTTAQLAAQHLYGRPMLAMLPASDQPTIERALAKDSTRRWPSCRAMVDALDANRTTLEAPAAACAPTSETSATEALRSTMAMPAGGAAPNLRSTPSSLTGPALARSMISAKPAHGSSNDGARALEGKVIDGPALELPPGNDWARPTLIIGLGGVGINTLRKLKCRLLDRFGPRTSIQAVQLLGVDTHRRTVHEAASGDEASALETRQLLHLPLQSSSDYRDKSHELLKWMNRRWLYNVPRSLETEGFRPLGRLAFIDQAQIFWNRVASALSTASDAHGLITSSAVTGLKFKAGSPRVFVVASANGGSASGMVPDVLFGLRRMLAAQGIDDEHLTLVLTHSTDRRAATRDLSIANSYACLRELHHFGRMPFVDTESCSESGSLAAGLPHSYVIHLGDDLSDEQFERNTSMLAEFLFRRSLTPAAAFFDAAQAHTGIGGEGFEPMVRSIGLGHLGKSNTEIPHGVLDGLCRSTLETWLGELTASNRGQPVRETSVRRSEPTETEVRLDEARAKARTFVQQQKLSSEGIIRSISDLVAKEVGQDFLSWLERSLAKSAGTVDGSDALVIIEQALDDLAQAVEPRIGQISAAFAVSAEAFVVNVLETNTARLNSAHAACQWIVEHLNLLKRELELRMFEIEAGVTSHAGGLGKLDPKSVIRLLRSEKRSQTADTPLLLALPLLLEAVILRRAKRLAGDALTTTSQLSWQLNELRRDLNQIKQSFPSPPEVASQDRPWQQATNELDAFVVRHMTALVACVERDLESQLPGCQAGLRRMVKLPSDARGRLPQALRSAARAAIVNLFKEDRTTGSGRTGWSDEALRTAAQESKPRLSACGGVLRRLVVVPPSSAAASDRAAAEELAPRVASALGGPATVIFDDQDEPLVGYDLERIPLREVAAYLLGGRTDLVQVADRLKTRIDIPWLSMS